MTRNENRSRSGAIVLLPICALQLAIRGHDLASNSGADVVANGNLRGVLVDASTAKNKERRGASSTAGVAALVTLPDSDGQRLRGNRPPQQSEKRISSKQADTLAI